MSTQGQTTESRAMRDRVLFDGLHFGMVEDNADPEKLGRLRVRVAQVHSEDRAKVPTKYLPWASRINMGGSDTDGQRWVPPIGRQVAVFFFHGRAECPFWVGTVEGFGDVPAEVAGRDPEGVSQNIRGNPTFPGSNLTRSAVGATRVHVMRTPRGHKLLLDDNDETPTFAMETAGGHRLVADDHPDRLRLEIQTPAGNNLTLDDGPLDYSRASLTSAGGHQLRFLDETGVTDRVILQSNAGHTLLMRDDAASTSPGKGIRLNTSLSPSHRLLLEESDPIFPAFPMTELLTPGGLQIKLADGNDNIFVSAKEATLQLQGNRTNPPFALLGVQGGGGVHTMGVYTSGTRGFQFTTDNQFSVMAQGVVQIVTAGAGGQLLIQNQASIVQIISATAINIIAPAINLRSA